MSGAWPATQFLSNRCSNLNLFALSILGGMVPRWGTAWVAHAIFAGLTSMVIWRTLPVVWRKRCDTHLTYNITARDS